MTDQFMTYPELKNVGVLMNFLNTYLTSKETPLFVGFDVDVSDQNGEPMGFITMRNGEYVLLPERPND